MLAQLGWYTFQATVAAVIFYFLFDKPAGLAPAAISLFIAWILTGVITRLIDAWRFGWKASRPTPITRDQKIDGNLTVLKWALYWVCCITLIYSFPKLAEGTIPGILAIVASLSMLVAALALRSLLLSRSGRLRDEPKSDLGRLR